MATAHHNLSEFDTATVPSGTGKTFYLVVSEWNTAITEALYEGAVSVLTSFEVAPENIIRWNVPGSFELIYGAKKAQEKKPDAVIAIGSVIKGETPHFDFICQGVAQGIKDLNVQSQVPVIFCVLTDNTLEQAQARSGGKHGNKGKEAAVAALKMAALGQL
ncbi:MAG: 6,7-dimethyl-8-ribityllumazine synthase [Flavobacteriaceae bacterium]